MSKLKLTALVATVAGLGVTARVVGAQKMRTAATTGVSGDGHQGGGAGAHSSQETTRA